MEENLNVNIKLHAESFPIKQFFLKLTVTFLVHRKQKIRPRSKPRRARQAKNRLQKVSAKKLLVASRRKQASSRKSSKRKRRKKFNLLSTKWSVTRSRSSRGNDRRAKKKKGNNITQTTVQLMIHCLVTITTYSYIFNLPNLNLLMEYCSM